VYITKESETIALLYVYVKCTSDSCSTKSTFFVIDNEAEHEAVHLNNTRAMLLQRWDQGRYNTNVMLKQMNTVPLLHKHFAIQQLLTGRAAHHHCLILTLLAEW